LFIGIFSNGDALIQQDIKSNPLAKELSIGLIGTNVTNLVVKNYSSHSLSYYVIVKSNELRIKSQGSSEIRITYITPTIVDKQDRIWTFSINSTSKFTVKLPNDAVVTSLGEHQPNLIRRLGEQELLTFDAGKSTVNYILGYVGTREQAETALISAGGDITAAQNALSGINLTHANELLEQAQLALENGNFVDAERFASNSSYLVTKISSDFELAKETIGDANEKIRSFRQINLDVNQAESLLSQSNIKFATGKYAEAANLARMALESLANRAENGNQNLVQILGAISLIALSGLFILFYVKRLRSKKRHYDSIGVDAAESISHDETHNVKNQQNTPHSKTDAETGMELPISNEDHVAQAEKHSEIRKLVEAKLMEYPNLRKEDEKVIYYLAEKEGSAFESEIRTEFILPKTSLWRLVKRLERLELIEVTKMAGQNLLKLKL
jgi:uncharacterized membrane protein